jgi:hypothetical protein
MIRVLYAQTMAAAMIISALTAGAAIRAFADDGGIQFEHNPPETTATTTKDSGSLFEKGSNWFLYGDRSQFSTSSTPGSNPYDSQTVIHGGIGYRW